MAEINTDPLCREAAKLTAKGVSCLVAVAGNGWAVTMGSFFPETSDHEIIARMIAEACGYDKEKLAFVWAELARYVG